MSEFADSADDVTIELKSQAFTVWAASAHQAGVDIAGFDPSYPLDERLDAAKKGGLAVATIYVSSSGAVPNALTDQVRALADYAGSCDIYVPPEYVIVDWGPRIGRRPGLEQLRSRFLSDVSSIILVVSLSRLSRGQKELSEFCSDENARAVVVSMLEGRLMYSA